uniref:Cytochrome b6-f complex subunit 6 n=1 Tax=Haptophyceae sp. NIES-3900 TaxID=2748608 RepID=A0A7R7AHN4_9EUKA|nr:cytochrome b6-f complex subunit 6 [Haptophyceae sp. NIES-3900]
MRVLVGYVILLGFVFTVAVGIYLTLKTIKLI